MMHDKIEQFIECYYVVMLDAQIITTTIPILNTTIVILLFFVEFEQWKANTRMRGPVGWLTVKYLYKNKLENNIDTDTRTLYN